MTCFACTQVQFVLVMVHAFQLLFIECDYPKAFVWWIGLHAVMFYFLFSDFYKKTYNRRDKDDKKVKFEVRLCNLFKENSFKWNILRERFRRYLLFQLNLEFPNYICYLQF